ncbi:MAG: hypothetical protein SPLUMA1_SPLUMAMAG1_00458 [uncultured Sulfurimonas sp.]|nr:MAG: hypothetical protein SPLUMA1_SPLUMAMAG1_00458 [uncultured Sulfurimonas sp.]
MIKLIELREIMRFFLLLATCIFLATALNAEYIRSPEELMSRDLDIINLSIAQVEVVQKEKEIKSTVIPLRETSDSYAY